MTRRLWGSALLACAALYALALVAAGRATGFHVGLNDFWGNYYLSSAADLSRPGTLYNGFFPFGYTLATRLIGGGSPAAGMFLVNVALAVLLALSVAAAAWRLLSPGWALAAFAAVCVWPAMFRCTITIGPDLGSAAWFTAGAAVLLIAMGGGKAAEGRTWLWFAGGLLLGLSGLWRYHGLVAGGALLAALACAGFRLRTAGLAAAGMLLAYSPQFAVNLLAGKGLLETDQAFNVYKLIHGVDWLRINPDAVPGSVLKIIAADPARFALRYAAGLLRLLWLLVAPLLALAFGASESVRRASGVIAMTVGIYCLVVAAGDSPRADRAVLPLVILACTVVAHAVMEPGLRDQAVPFQRWVLRAGAGLCLAMYLAFALQTNVELVQAWVRDHAQYLEVERILRADGVRSAKEVFSNDVRLYLPGTPPLQLWQNGNWMRFDQSYNQRYPDLPDDSIGSFLRACREKRITHLVLTGSSGALLPELQAIHAGQSAAGVHPLGASGEFRVFRIGGK